MLYLVEGKVQQHGSIGDSMILCYTRLVEACDETEAEEKFKNHFKSNDNYPCIYHSVAARASAVIQ